MLAKRAGKLKCLHEHGQRTVDAGDARAGRPFSADEHLFQLPAMMAPCSLAISVETAVQVPVIALIRRDHPEWAALARDVRFESGLSGFPTDAPI